MLPTRIISKLWVALALFSALAWSQANIDEGQETSTLYVDTVKGSDSNPGTQQLPFKTIAVGAAAATTNNQAGIGTKVVVNPGTYRESVTMMHSGKSTSLPITIQAAQPGTVIVSGADIVGGWKQNGGSSIYTNTWANKWGLCPLDTGGESNPPPEEDIIRRREMVIINGTVLTQVTSGSATKYAGTFYVDEAHGSIYVWPPAGTDMKTATVEIPSRANLFTITDTGNIVLRGMTFQYANSCRTDTAVAVEFSADNVLLDNDTFQWNNAAGLVVQFATDTTVQNSTANHNGTSGFKGYESKYDLWQDNQARYNGWRAAQGAYYAWGSSGIHFGLSHNQTLSGLDIAYNQTHGIHWDTDSMNVTLDNSTFSQNLLANGFSEKNEGPITITNTNFCSGAPSVGADNIGFELRNTTNISLSGGQIYNNTQGLMIEGTRGGIRVKNWETGQYTTLVTSGISLSNETIVGTGTNPVFADESLNGADWTTFLATLSSDYNTWWNSSSSSNFEVPVPKYYTFIDFPTWQATTLRDVHSTWSAPSNGGAGCAVTPDKPDWWFNTEANGSYQTISAGSSAVFTLNIVPVGNYTGSIAMTADGLQSVPGATANWSSKKINNFGSATYTLATTKSTPKGAYNLTLLANDGASTKALNVTVTVQ